MRQAILNPAMPGLTESPLMAEGKLYVLGGRIVANQATEEGSLVEAFALPVNSRGEITSHEQSTGRFLAIYPRGKGLLDPVIFAKDRDITVAGVFKGTRTRKLGDMQYPYAFFEIVEIRLWEKPQPVRYHPSPLWYDPWYDPWWGPYWHRPYRWHR